MASQQNTYPPYQQGHPQNQTPQQQQPSDNDLLPKGQERSEQMEHFQSFEASAPQSEDDLNQATLQKEFPSLDSSLIAAIYGDSKSLSATREMLYELTKDTQK